MGTTKALLLDGGEVSEIEVDGINGIREKFSGKGDLRGKTLGTLTEHICLREWKSCAPDPRGIKIIEAYDLRTKQPVDLPISLGEYRRIFGAERAIGVSL
jgi:hypothetical protein